MELVKGDKLRNGATILKSKGNKVLADFRGEFVVWTVNELEAFWGHYFKDNLIEASMYFDEITG